MKDKAVLIVLDSLKYQVKEAELTKKIENLCFPEYYYTYYENALVRFFHGLPVIGNFFSHLAYWSISLKSAFLIFFKKKKVTTKIFINPIVAIFYCLITRIFPREEQVTIAGFLFEDKSNKFYLRARKAFVNFSYKNTDRIIVYSNNEVKYYSTIFPSLTKKFYFVEYGRDFDIFEENVYQFESNYYSSGGVSNRDFVTLLEASKLLLSKYPQLVCNIATRPQGIAAESAPENVNVLYNIRIDTFGSFLKKSLFVVLPLANTKLSAGHMALLEAMSLGKVILITDIPSVRDYVNECQVFFYAPENPMDLAEKIEHIYLNLGSEDVGNKAQAAFKSYSKSYTFGSLLKRLVELSMNNF
ncbi:glycosyltransferase [Pedobacter sandarakinus]|uniref:glycosyltransferase n=1 Tax=Pedobacter sandarakinus TaxID=353156 RepID=UPI0022456E95|nr:glycosyltransferase [Pedobacter sandarakinus]MCX2574020.1 glycosyltransferase [Pedobacter sandarakinus]